MSPYAMSRAQRRARIALADQVADAGGCMADLADQLEISRAAVSQWFRKNPDLVDVADRLRSNARHAPPLVGTERRRIVLLIRVARKQITLTEAATRIGVSPSALCQWRDRNWIALHEAMHERRAA